jgi:amidohydrolase
MLKGDELLRAVEPCVAEAIAIRHDIHAHPETAFEEVRTAALVAEKLRRLGVEVVEGVGRTGVVGTLKGRRPGQRAVGLRADMDALNIEEKTGLSYASQNAGKMHACGHDGHTAMLLGAARFLSENPDFGGTVYFIFQPAEEGHGGARVMIEDGLFDRFPCDAVYALHNKPGIPVGKFGTRSGAILASSDTWKVVFHGTGGHGGSGAHLAVDPTVPLAHFVLGLQTIVGRSVPAVEPAVLSVGYISGGAFGAPNVIPYEVVVRGTARSFSPAIRDLMENRLCALAKTLAAAYGATAEVEYLRRYPPLVNRAEQVAVAAEVAGSLVSFDNVNADIQPVTGAEDFSFMLERKPGAFMYLGNGGSAGEPFHNLHTPRYDFNDAIIPLGISYWVRLVAKELGVQDA